MTTIDVDSLSLAELRDLISVVATRINTLENQTVLDKDAARRAIVQSRTTLEVLRGPEEAVPALDSIRGVLAFGDETIAANAAVATPLIVHALDILTAVMIDITRVVNDPQDQE